MYTLLSIAKAHHASDLHITVGVRPKCRISGTLYEMDGFEKLTPAMTKELVESMFGPKQKATMEATGEVDFAFPSLFYLILFVIVCHTLHFLDGGIHVWTETEGNHGGHW